MTEDEGRSIRLAMFGTEIPEADAFNRPLHDEIKRIYSEVWARPGLDLKTRSIVTVVLLAAQGREEELRNHVRGALANGVTPEELSEVFLQAAAYGGIPTAVAGFRAASQVFAARADKP